MSHGARVRGGRLRLRRRRRGRAVLGHLCPLLLALLLTGWVGSSPPLPAPLRGALPAGGAPLQLADTLRPAPPPEAVRATLSGVLEADGVRVRFAPSDSLFAARVLEAARSQRPLPAVDPELPGPVEIFLPVDDATLALLLGGRRPEWSAALAIPEAGWVILPSGRGERTGRRELLGEVLRHELAHIGLHRAVHGYRGPRWFVEGYAQWASGWSVEEAWRLRVALAMDDSLGLEALTLRWPAGRDDAEVAYLLSATVMEYLARNTGERGIRVLLDRWRETGDFEGALRRTFGFSSSQLEESWKGWVTERYGWLFVLTRSGVGWGLLAGLLFLLVWARRRYRKDRMAQLRAAELPDAPDWWSVTLRDPDEAFGAREGGAAPRPLGEEGSDTYRERVEDARSEDRGSETAEVDRERRVEGAPPDSNREE